VYSSPAVVNGVVFVGSYDSNVYALNASTGAKLWSYTTGSGVYSSPAVANGVVYIGSYDNNVYALNARTGAKVWNYATGDVVSSSPAVANGWFMSAQRTEMYTRWTPAPVPSCGGMPVPTTSHRHLPSRMECCISAHGPTTFMPSACPMATSRSWKQRPTAPT
jgi:hypothetical protein